MGKLIKRIEFENLFLPFIENGKQIWVVTRVKELPIEIVNMALKLAELDFLKFIRICDKSLAASSENYPNRPKVPIVTDMDYPAAIGVELLYSTARKTIDFYDINSPVKGCGSKMIAAILHKFPKGWLLTVIFDWSNGFWKKMEKKYKNLDWIMV